MPKLCLLYNFAPKYREGIFTLIDKEFDCKWYFGCNDTNIDVDDSKVATEYDEYLCSLLKDPDKYKSYLKSELKKLWPEYKLYLLRGLSAVTPTLDFHLFSHSTYGLLKGADIPLLINNFPCESHCWAIERMLNLQLNER